MMGEHYVGTMLCCASLHPTRWVCISRLNPAQPLNRGCVPQSPPGAVFPEPPRTVLTTRYQPPQSPSTVCLHSSLPGCQHLPDPC